MDKTYYLLVFVIVAINCFAGCGYKSDLPVPLENNINTNADTGLARLVVNNSRSHDSLHSYSEIDFYRATITGIGIDFPIIAEFDGKAENGTMSGIPVGNDRVITIDAVSKRGEIIRKGIRDNVLVEGNKVNDIEISLNSVPIFTNIKNGNTIPSTRLRPEVFADPGETVEIIRVINEQETPIFNISSNTSEIYADTNSGLATLDPMDIGLGEYSLIVRSLETGYESSVDIKIIDGTKIKAAPLYSLGSVEYAESYIGVSRMGSAYNIINTGGAIWPRVLDHTLYAP